MRPSACLEAVHTVVCRVPAPRSRDPAATVRVCHPRRGERAGGGGAAPGRGGAAGRGAPVRRRSGATCSAPPRGAWTRRPGRPSRFLRWSPPGAGPDLDGEVARLRWAARVDAGPARCSTPGARADGAAWLLHRGAARPLGRRPGLAGRPARGGRSRSAGACACCTTGCRSRAARSTGAVTARSVDRPRRAGAAARAAAGRPARRLPRRRLRPQHAARRRRGRASGTSTWAARGRRPVGRPRRRLLERRPQLRAGPRRPGVPGLRRRAGPGAAALVPRAVGRRRVRRSGARGARPRRASLKPRARGRWSGHARTRRAGAGCRA